MLFNLVQYLKECFEFPGMRLFTYITFRAFAAMLLSLTIALIAGKRIIILLAKKQIGEEIRELGLEGEKSKKGTPTMGGIIILISAIAASLLFADLTNIYVWLLIISALWLGGIGLVDDYIKVFRKNKEGLQGRFKIYGQISLGIVVGLSLYFSNQAVIRVVTPAGEITSDSRVVIEEKSTKTTIPFIKNNEFDYKWISPIRGEKGKNYVWIVYIIVIIFIITAVSNGTNLTDGMDGLLTGVSAITVVTLAILAYLSGNIIYSNYLNIMYLPNTGEIVIVLAAFIGALVGFLWYNSYPAQVFMGDTGSLAIGGVIAVAAIAIKKELLIPLLCGIFFVESLSVIVQRYYFKYSRKRYGKGRRVIKMAPLHHHFQVEGVEAMLKRPLNALPEAKIVVRFWIIAIFLAMITVITLKIR
ncbi:MAG: phospho-N-acetylmuramoyl-pentapeptide-transferase [Bacteroidales bacterium]